MSRRRRRNLWSSPTHRGRKRPRLAVYPLSGRHAPPGGTTDHPTRPSARRSTPGLTEPFVLAAQPSGTAPSYQVAVDDTEESGAGASRGVRILALSIAAMIPLVVLIWAATIIVPIAIEARQAADKIFVTPVDRVRFATPVTDVPLVPDTTPTTGAIAEVPTPTTTPATPTVTVGPGTPTPTPAPVATATATPYPAWDGTRPLHILLLGVDTRIGESEPPRSDTMIVVRIDPVAKRVDMVSIPRDLLVEIPGYYATKVNAAYPFGELDGSIPGGGPTLAAQTVEYNFGIPIDYFAEVDIAGMERVVDILGGIIIDVPGIIKDDQFPTETYGYTRIYFTPGLQRLDGRRAVQYSRTRHYDGDFARQSRQHEVLRAIRAQAEATGIITRLPELIAEVGDSVRTDLSISQVLSLARLSQDIDDEDVHSHSMIPYISELWSDDGFYLVGDWIGIRAMFADLPNNPYLVEDPITTPTPASTPPVNP